ncbi:putative lipoprotein YutC [Lentibacillus sp. JNUCC-1]|uniref:YhcN/YlaJ family sporulation lipoprotein n=1 Tax=Lentibacillus sp. JNUCC-1 TaxID=2654513 RepID=UPI0013242E18|nr:YhcN/YlaJ family sporulation lipoprotein [Lentibacillus sp. JNUCC-1]MUV39176.1 putative lipoprotein YutC [Lentibacillus sp. JNUCC-1]
MRLLFLTVACSGLLFMSACANDNNNAIDDGNDTLNNLHPDEELSNQDHTSDNEKDYRLGYVRFKKEQLDQNAEDDRMITVDRKKMADIITRTILRNKGFDEVATLVTSDTVLIAYDKADDREAQQAADIAKQTAVAVMPSFYKVYVSDNKILINDIHSLHNSSVANPDYKNTIESIITEMKKSPQGIDQNKKMPSDGENE